MEAVAPQDLQDFPQIVKEVIVLEEQRWYQKEVNLLEDAVAGTLRLRTRVQSPTETVRGARPSRTRKETQPRVVLEMSQLASRRL